MLNPPISEKVTLVLHSGGPILARSAWHPRCRLYLLDAESSSSSPSSSGLFQLQRAKRLLMAPMAKARKKSLIIAVISWWWDDDSWWWYWWFYDNLIFYQPISLMFTVDASSWASLQKLWRDQYHMCWKYEYLKQPAMVDRSESSYNIYLTTRLVKMGKKRFASWVMPTEKINCNQWSSRGSKLSQEGHALVPPKMTEVWDTKNSS